MKMFFSAALLVAAQLSTFTIQAQTPLSSMPPDTKELSALVAKEVLTKHSQALGGPEKMSQLKTVIVRQTTSVQNQDVPQTLYIVPGKSVRSEMNAAGIEIIVAARADSGWQVNPALYGNQIPVSLTAKQAKSACAQSDLFGPLVTAVAKGHTVTYDGEEKVEGELCYKLTVAMITGGQYVAFISQKTNMLLKMITKSTEVYYLDYRNVDGYWFPHVVEVVGSGNKATLNDRHFEVNKPIDDTLFKMPTVN